MTERFNPYHRWLSIPPAEQPPNHYRLLGISLFEDDAEVIETASKRQMAHIRQYQSGPHSELSNKLLVRIKKVREILLDPEKKKAYDALLRDTAKTNEAQNTPRKRPPNLTDKKSQQTTKREGSGLTVGKQHPLQDQPSQSTSRSWKMPVKLVLNLILTGIAGLMVLVFIHWSQRTDPQEPPPVFPHSTRTSKLPPPPPSPGTTEVPDVAREFSTSPLPMIFGQIPQQVPIAEEIDVLLRSPSEEPFTRLNLSGGSGRYALVEQEVSGLDCTVVDLQEGKFLTRISVEEPCFGAFISPDGAYCVSIRQRGSIQADVWSVSSGKRIGQIPRSDSLRSLKGVAISPQGELFLVAPEIRSCYLEIWKLPECRQVTSIYWKSDRMHRRKVPNLSPPKSMRPSLLPMSPDGRYLCLALSYKKPYFFDIQHQRLVEHKCWDRTLGEFSFQQAYFSPDSRTLVLDFPMHRSISIFDSAKLEEIHFIARGVNFNRHEYPSSRIEWFSDSRHCVVDSNHIVDTEIGEKKGHISRVAFGRRHFIEDRRAVGLWCRELGGWRLTTLGFILSRGNPSYRSVYGSRWNADPDPSPSPAPIEKHWEFPLGDTRPLGVCFPEPNGRYAIVSTLSSEKKVVRDCVDIYSGKQTLSITGISDPELPDVQINPEGTHWAIQRNTHPSTLEVWAPMHAAPIFKLEDVLDTVFLPGHRLLVIPDFDKKAPTRQGPWQQQFAPTRSTIEIWDYQQNHLCEVILFPSPVLDVRMMAVSPGGRYLALASNSILHIFDLKELDCIGSVRTNLGSFMQTMTFSPDGRELLMSEYSHLGLKMALWNLTDDKNSIHTKSDPKIYLSRLSRTDELSFRRLNWLSDQSGWCLGGRILGDRQTSKMTSILRDDSPFERLFLSSRRVIEVYEHPSKKWVLRTRDLVDEEFIFPDPNGRIAAKKPSPPKSDTNASNTHSQSSPSKPFKHMKPLKWNIRDTPAQSTIPSEAEQEKNLELLREVLAKEYADATTETGKRKLIDAMIDVAIQVSDDRTAEYVAWREAANTAAQLGDIPNTFSLVNRLSIMIRSEPWDVLIIVSKTLCLSVRGRKDQMLLANRVFDHVEKAIFSLQFDAAEKLIQVNESLADKTRSKTLAEKCDRVRHRNQETETRWNTYRKAIVTLKTEPEDNLANQTVGLWNCCMKGYWSSGLSSIEKAKNPKFAEMLRAERRDHNTIESRLNAGNQWWDLAENDTSIMRPGMLCRAAYWYEMVKDDLDDQSTVKSRLREIEKLIQNDGIQLD